ncbi:MAG: TetR/AcrR family transcriptional regulator C-terminal domain-containing protein [Spirochaetales bacterium]|nr:TetR/AcrR family transcriptional regulator C-terminal domain-containing protein [Spirochaetales bacterium]
MYHIKKDKRSVRSAERLYKGLIECLKRKSISDVTISDICQVSEVGRATFYRTFDTITDILYMKCDLSFKEVLQGFINDTDLARADRFSLIRYYIDYWINNSEILENLIMINRLDIIFTCHRNNSRIISERFEKDSLFTEKEMKYLIALRSGETISLLITWVEGGKRESPSELIRTVEKILRESNRSYFYL